MALTGTWNLVAYYYEDSEIEYTDDQDFPAQEIMANWLKGNSDQSLAEAKPASGLTLTLTEDQFSEENKDFTQLIFDVEGVQVDDYKPMHGSIKVESGLTLLEPAETPNWAQEGDCAPYVRFDDGDTKITESIKLIDKQLIRTQSVITDEIYLSRVVLIYKYS